MKPEALSSYEFCRGQSPVNTHVCPDREHCKRFLPSGYDANNYRDFWLASSCPKFEAKERNVDEPARTEW